jgi:histidine triad (HIT) family protein
MRARETMTCIFCDIVAKRAAATTIYEDDEVMAFQDIHPQAPIHVLVIPRLHIATVNDLEEPHIPLMGKLFLVGPVPAANG